MCVCGFLFFYIRGPNIVLRRLKGIIMCVFLLLESFILHVYHNRPKYCIFTITEPIKSMMFRFGANKDEYLTRDNNEAIHQMEVLSGKYAPSCEAMGGMPKANIQIMMGDQMMQGKIMDIENKMGTKFVADATDFRGQ